MIDLLNPKVDFVFKNIFGKLGNEDILADLINSVLNLPEGRRIIEVRILNPIQERTHKDDKLSILDVYAIADDKTHYNIEIQRRDEHNIDRRTVYHFSVIYANQMYKGMDYINLAKTVTINILDFKYLYETQKYHSTFHLYEDEEKFLFTDIEEIHIIELPKMLEQWRAGKISPRQNDLIKWLMLLQSKEDMTVAKELEVLAMENPVVEKAMEVWKTLSQDPEARYEFQSRMRAEVDYNSSISAAERRGESRGERRGERRGFASGKTLGKVEANREVIHKYLFKRFGTTSSKLQENVQQLNTPEALNFVLEELFTTNTLDEANAVINDAIRSENRSDE